MTNFWNRLTAGATALQADLKARASRFNNKNFANATMAICALVASADGNVSSDEKRKVAGFIQRCDLLQAFDMASLKVVFDHHCDDINDDVDFGRVNALGVVGKLRGKPDEIDTAISVALIIANADGNFDDSEKAIVREICRTLGVDHVPYGV